MSTRYRRQQEAEIADERISFALSEENGLTEPDRMDAIAERAEQAQGLREEYTR